MKTHFKQQIYRMLVTICLLGSLILLAPAPSTAIVAVQAKPESPEKTLAQTAVQGLETEAAKGEDADEGKVQTWFDHLGNMAPDIFEVAVDTFTNPIKGISTVFKKVAERAKAEKWK